MKTSITLLQEANALIRMSLAYFAQTCSEENGRLSTSKLDEHQPVLYALACQQTMLLAAQQLEADALASADTLLQQLAAVFSAETIQTLTQWQFRDADFGFAQGTVAAFLQQPATIDFVQSQLSATHIEGVAARLAVAPPVADFGLDETQQAFQQMLRRYAAERIEPLAEAIHREGLDVPEQLIDELAEMGCYGLSIPQRYGGFEDDDQPDHLMMVIASDELSRASFGTAGSLITRPELLSKALVKGGTDAQKQQLLPRIANGQVQTAVAITEPDFGSNVAALSVKAERVNGGWRLSGTKTWCTNAGRAEIIMTLARTESDPALGHKGLTLFIVEKPRASGRAFHHEINGGTITGRAIPTIGYRGMHSFELVFENYFVPDANVIGGEGGLGRGFYLQMHGFAGSRLQTAGRALGLMAAAFSEGYRYINERHVFGKPLIDYGLVRHHLVLMAARIQACRRLTFYAAKQLDRGQGDVAAAMAKLLTAQSAEIITRQAQQWHGGMGYAEEFTISRHFVDARVLAIFEGAEEVLALRIIARALLKEVA